MGKHTVWINLKDIKGKSWYCDFIQLIHLVNIYQAPTMCQAVYLLLIVKPWHNLLRDYKITFS